MKKISSKNNFTITEKINELQKKYNDTYSELRYNETKLFNLKWTYEKEKKSYGIKRSLIHSFMIYFISVISLFCVISLFYNISLLSLCILGSVICVCDLFVNVNKNMSRYFELFDKKEISLIRNDEINKLEVSNFDLQNLCELIYDELINVKKHLSLINDIDNENKREFKLAKNDNNVFGFQDQRYSKEKALVLR